MDERFVAGEEAVPAGEEIALEPALALVLAQHLHHPAVGTQVIVGRQDFCDPDALGHLEDGSRAVGGRLVRAEDAKFVSRVPLDDVAQEVAHARAWPRLYVAPGCGNLHGVVAEVRQAQIAEQSAAVGVGVRAHATLALGASSVSSRIERTGLVEQLLGSVALIHCSRSRMCSRRSWSPRAAPDANARVPSTGRRRPPSARSSPSGCAGRSSAREASLRPPRARAATGSLRSHRRPIERLRHL